MFPTYVPTQFPQVFVSDHALIRHKIGLLRRKETGTKDFRQLVGEIAQLLFYEASRDLPLDTLTVNTPICETTVETLAGKSPAIVPILRAGLGMDDAILSLIPNADVGHIGLYRGDDLQPVNYYCKLPSSLDKRVVFLLDPMLATGNSVCAAVDALKNAGAKEIIFLCIIAATEGLMQVLEKHPDVRILAAAYDHRPLNEHGYIVPGLGDAGDRIFGTK